MNIIRTAEVEGRKDFISCAVSSVVLLLNGSR